MSPETLHALRNLPVFPTSAELLIQVIGIEAAARLITAWPGQSFPVPSPALVRGVLRVGGPQHARLRDVVGSVAAEKIIRHWRGSDLYIPSCKEAIAARARDHYRARFDELTGRGYSYTHAVFEIGIQFGVTGKTIEKALKEADTLPPDPLPFRQGDFFR
ncbi:MAG: hypothetical protein LBS89_02115 [Zoogloeaceae bacterium]|jgi:hypothetical protein|nr:hypothetical protein [Zoogloeaceae bacterium]